MVGSGRSRLERALGIFGDVRSGEGRLVAALGLQVFVLLTGYYLLKTAREPLILLGSVWGLSGSELKTYGTAAQAGLLLALLPVYSWLVGRLPRWRLIRFTLLLFAGSLGLFILAGLGGLPIGVPFFMWLGMMSLLLVAQFWSLANDLYERLAGERLFGVIAIGGSVGAIAGAQLARWLIEPLGVYVLMAIAAALYLAASALTSAVQRANQTRKATAGDGRERLTMPAVADSRGVFSLVLRDRYLLLLGLMLLLANLVNTQGEYILADTVKAYAEQRPPEARAAYIGGFYGNFYTVVNVASLVIQALVVSRLFKTVGARLMVFVLPAVALAAYGMMALVPVLAVVSAAKAVENGLDYSLQNTLRQALFLPTSREAKYKGKAAIDTTFVRIGDSLAAGLVFVGIHVLGLSRAGFATVNILLALMWMVAAVAIARRHREIARDELQVARSRLRAKMVVSTAAVLVLAGVCALSAVGCAGARGSAERRFPDRPVAWHEHDDANVAQAPERTDLSRESLTLILRDNFPNDIDYALSGARNRPARDVNALDEVPCSTWFCPRNHVKPLSSEEVAAGPAAEPPQLPLTIVKGKEEGATMGFQVVDAAGRKFMMKVDPAGHVGMTTGAEMVGARFFHAAGYNVPANFLLALGPQELLVSPEATYRLQKVKKRQLTESLVRQKLAMAARDADGRLRVVVVSWVPGTLLDAFDMLGRRGDDPNDRIPHEDRRSLRASWILDAWLAIFDASAINTLDSYVEENGRHFVRHYFIDFGAGLGSSSYRSKGPHEGEEHVIEVGRTLGAVGALGFVRRPYAGQRERWEQQVAAHPSVGWFPAEEFDPDNFRTLRKVPAHRRMTDRDAYWGAKLVTAFSDAQVDAVAATAGMDPAEEAYLAHALRVRRDIIGRRYLRSVTAVEAPFLSAGGASLCFDDLAVTRGYLNPREVTYLVSVRDVGGSAPTAPSRVTSAAARVCVPIGSGAPGVYRIVAVTAQIEGAEAKPSRVHLSGGRIVGLERDE
jgi:ATP:ADP antiporter, AAA family